MSELSKFICNCKCVSKSEILSSIRKKGANSFSDVRTITLATTGCGRCKSDVENIVNQEMKKHSVRMMQFKIDFGND
ncbi:MAG TPA: (2Fe-2S)-binding protein [Tenuifilaceae bacterium]|mgnify:FL=1|nr:(2Fe-2S)-binding protein [Tenuifilaceae bacterium]HOZ13264.1 (2Fe-2S)-binding protein [Tenuifilaceae bacterium]HPI45152.1 (2Fe-2S)-binding protein [Tenuifilaceae bacterium]HPN23181.1 (2Fe-2S)-binding protein [Tenuifilaceae bacterium]HPV55806.1 (2Fe-2S)-binding protein [Tenuifilaceae bacterium]